MKIWCISRRYCLLAIFSFLVPIGFILSQLIAGQSGGKTIVIDAGHGGVDTGANRPGVLEKDINLAIALAVRDILRSHGFNVVLTRDADTELSGSCDNDKVRGRYRRDLSARVEAVAKSGADLFVSIHANVSSAATRRGIECYFAPSGGSKNLALAIEEQLVLVAPISQRAKAGNFFVLRRSQVPAVLIEAGFITNQEERALLENPKYQRKLAEAISKGILKYYMVDL
ncbi:MAG: N-acetylmuramoyl-L-alanine amidase [Pelosinus sp.]|nr:N-acetylmuramoyl-L-alanine amidase [Pelosinus sp.]